MIAHATVHDGQVLTQDLDWLAKVLDTRFKLHFDQPDEYPSIEAVPVPEIPAGATGNYASFVRAHSLTVEERLLLLLALCPHVQPSLLDPLLVVNTVNNRYFSSFGGVPSSAPHPFLPTVETALWLLADRDLVRRFEVQKLLSAQHFFFTEQILRLEAQPGQGSFMGAQLMVTEQWFATFCKGHVEGIGFSTEFPAEAVSTEMEREDIVLNPTTWNSVEEILQWLEYKERFLALPGMKKRMRPGYRALFYGPPGTGKTMVACWLGKRTERPVYRIDLSMIVSKYIGETEKNLATIFRKAAVNDWILFFDEADALFGRRTQVSSSNDRHANQEVSFLLQRVETYPGLVILASNFKDNIDEAFTRRFDLMAHFTMPTPHQRLQLWQSSFSPALPFDPALDLFALAKKYELAGGNITNVVRFATMKALGSGQAFVSETFILEGIKKEMHKLGIARMD
jgi:AAA+ superfamily predicted ATPase